MDFGLNGGFVQFTYADYSGMVQGPFDIELVCPIEKQAIFRMCGHWFLLLHDRACKHPICLP